MSEIIRIAIQKSGRLYEGSMSMLKECGLDIIHGKNQLRVPIENFPAEILFLRDDDIPEYVQDAVSDLGIAGLNVVKEKDKMIDNLENLGFGKCRLSIAVPKNGKIRTMQDLNGKKIASSYPLLLQSFLTAKNINAEIHHISGSVEIAPKIGLADAICDLVSSGSTLFTNELEEVETILESEAVLIANKSLSVTKKNIVARLLFRIRAVKKAKNNKYLLLNAPDNRIKEICALLPGMKSPTILPLAARGWSSVHTVIDESDFWNVIEKLKENGAEGILIIPIEKMIL